MNVWLLHVRTVVRTDNLAQAILSRLSEIGRDSPKSLARVVAQATDLRFERENVSLRRGDLASASKCRGPLFLVVELSPRRKELA
ncbi:hypothetical protein DEO72_LG6g950 [Vigna unguiculata]|uniref:Uncharacterized protein n=1 Tax=Vigna unguiculata TaxID=3917 RepID=A0A4D6M6U9_VIGUN|nr:hypothetical protein DEO72_LG6g950 [Vigna unguiculata]